MSEPRVSVQEFAEALGGSWSREEVVSEWVALGLKPRADWGGRASITVSEAGMAYAAITAEAAEAEAKARATAAEWNARQKAPHEYQFLRDEVERKLRGYVSPGAIHGAKVQAVERVRQGEQPERVIAEVVLEARRPVQATYFGA